MTRQQLGVVVVFGLISAALLAPAAEADKPGTVHWPDRHRTFFQDGPALLLEPDQRREWAAMPEAEREELLERFLSDPIPETEINELREGIERRLALMSREFLSPLDDRARLLFLHGSPAERVEVECGQTFKPIEIWGYEGGHRLLLYRPGAGKAYRLWLPLDSKRALYNPEMEYWMEQWERLARGRVRRLDLEFCPQTRQVEEATGIAGLSGVGEDRPSNERLLAWLGPPDDLTAWSRRAAATSLPPAPLELPVRGVEVLFPSSVRQRVVARFIVTLPPGLDLGVRPSEKGDEEEISLAVEGVVEQEGAVFEDFKVRFQRPPVGPERPLALVFERTLRPERDFVARLKVLDEVNGAEARLARAFRVPAEPQQLEEPPVPEEAVVALGQQLEVMGLAGTDSLLLIPPVTVPVIGLWRAEALVTGARIAEVVFSVDGEVQLTRTSRPFSAEVRLARFPREQVVSAVGYDEAGDVVARDKVVVNQPQGALAVRILAPERGAAAAGPVPARAEITVPPDRRVERVEFRLGEETVGALQEPPWEMVIDVPGGDEISYLTVEAELDDGARAEDVRFLNAPKNLEELEVNLVEVYATVTDRSGSLVRDLEVDDFQLLEEGRLQTIDRFELVEDLPLTVGFTVDTSTSMASMLPEAKQATAAFLRNMIRPGDRAFALSFAGRPALLIPPTDDVAAVEAAMEDLQSVGWTSLHDAVVTSLFYFRGFRGRRALVLLSDGDDTASRFAFRDALEYARRSGVVVYTIGLDIGSMKVGVRRKLSQLAGETGGRALFIGSASELSGVYGEIEEELRSQYLLAYASERPAPESGYRVVEVKARDGKLDVRTSARF